MFILPTDDTTPVRVNHDQDATIPVGVNPFPDDIPPADFPPLEPEKPAKKGGRKKGGSGRFLWIFLGILVFIGLAFGGMYSGYQAGIATRMAKQNDELAVALVTQFELGVQDQAAGRLEQARKRYEYVIQMQPNYPGAMERLTEVMLSIAKTTAPTAVPTPTLSPTPDLRSVEEKYATAYTYLRSKDWDNAILTLEQLRKEDRQYRMLDVDTMFYIALRERGVQKIIGGGLEQGMYDLSLAERFAPLDKEATGFRNWARYYVIGISYWDLDWAQVVDYFRQIYAALPFLSDGTGWTAAERYRIATWKYGDVLYGLGEYCPARDQYNTSLSIANDPQLVPTANQAQYDCAPPTEVPSPGPKKKTATPEGSEEEPTATEGSSVIEETPTP